MNTSAAMRRKLVLKFLFIILFYQSKLFLLSKVLNNPIYIGKTPEMQNKTLAVSQNNSISRWPHLKTILIVPKIASLLYYGAAFLIQGFCCENQIHLVTMMRVTGWSRLSNSATKLSKAFKSKKEAISKEIPKLLEAKEIFISKNVQIHELGLFGDSQNELKPGEEIRLQIVTEELKTLGKAFSSLHSILEALQIKEIKEFGQGLVLIFGSVIASGHSSFPSRVVSSLCRMINITSLISRIMSKFEFHFVQLFFSQKAFKILSESVPNGLEDMKHAILFVFSFALVKFSPTHGDVLNNTLLGGLFILRGMHSFLYLFGRSPIPFVDGVLFIALGAFGILCHYMLPQKTANIHPMWLLLQTGEKYIEKFVKIVGDVQKGVKDVQEGFGEVLTF